MQLQMETCDLNECDFLETRFLEYSSYNEFISDGTFLKSEKDDLKGVIMYFSTPEGKPKYIYKPLNMDFEEFEGHWETEQMEMHQTNCSAWIKNIYWRLEEISCVLVLRNRKWFQDTVTTLSDTWETILKERESGCQHRAPTKRVKKEQQIEETACLLNFDKTTGKVSLNKTSSEKTNTILPFLKIRTESIDETKQYSHISTE